MPKAQPFGLSEPCVDCPFLRDRVFPLHPGRAASILHELIQQDGHFYCHKTVDYSEEYSAEDDDVVERHIPTAKTMHCAGAMILLKKLNMPNQMMRIAGRIGLLSWDKLGAAGGMSRVYDTGEEMIAAMERIEHETSQAIKARPQPKRQQTTKAADRRTKRA